MSEDYADEYRNFIMNLQREDHRPAALNEIKNLIIFKPGAQTTNTLRGVGISKILQCVNVENKSHVDLACEVLKLCFEKFNPGDVVKNYTPNLMYLLRHEKECVRRLAIDEVFKVQSLDINILPIPQYIDVFVAVAQLVSDKDVSIANKAILITSNLLPEAYPKVLEEMKIALEYDSSSKCNAFEVIVNISIKSIDLQLCDALGYIQIITAELSTQDVLYQMNLLELLSRLAVTPHGINFLIRNGTLDKIAQNVSELQQNQDPLAELLLPGYMKFFGCIAHQYPSALFNKYPILLDMVFGALDSNHPTILPAALDTLEYIGITVEGKLCLVAIGAKFTTALERVASLIRSSPTETKIRALSCFAGLIGIDKDPAYGVGPVDQRITLMTREWFRVLSSQPNSMTLLSEMCKNPFPEIRSAAFNLLDAVCQHNWGAECVAQVPGFVEYLLDRTVDSTKEAKEAKYDIIKKLSYTTAFDTNITTRLHTYVEKGPFYSETILQVAMEDANN